MKIRVDKQPLLWEQSLADSHVGLLGEFDFGELCSLGHHVLVLDAHDSASPDSLVGLILVELSSEVLGQHLQVLEVFLLHFGQGDACSSLMVHQFAQSCLTLDEAIGNALLSAQSWQEHHQLYGVDVVCHDNKLGLAFFNQGGNVVQAELDVQGLGGLVLGTCLLIVSLSPFSFLLETQLLLFVGLGCILGEELKELGCLVLVDDVLELVQGGRHLQSLEQDSLLALNPDVFGPLHKSSEISLWLDVSSNSECAWVLGEEGTVDFLVSTFTACRCSDYLLALGHFLWLYSINEYT